MAAPRSEFSCVLPSMVIGHSHCGVRRPQGLERQEAVASQEVTVRASPAADRGNVGSELTLSEWFPRLEVVPQVGRLSAFSASARPTHAAPLEGQHEFVSGPVML